MPDDPRRRRRWRDLVIDCAQPAQLARFWAAALRWEPPVWTEEDIEDLRTRGIEDTEEDPMVFILSDDLRLPRIGFQRVPEAATGKSLKNRLHLDVNIDTADEVDQLVGLGARVLERHPDDDGGGGWVVLADPEGNEFCAILH